IAEPPARACGVDGGEGDYLNCPFTREEYDRFHDALVAAESATVHDFDNERFFEGCLPIEVMAHRGRDTLRFGPMKPVGLVDPRTGREPYAAVQLRQDNLAGLNAAAMVKGEPLSCPPRTTAIGALAYYVSHANPAHYEPSNVTFGIIEALPKPPRGKMEKKLAIAERALRALEDWRARRHDGTAESVPEVSRA